MPETELSETLLIDKPAGMTSHDVVDQVRSIYKTRRVGHAGTLDPFATGLLIVAIGKATKDIQRFVGLDKTYEATARLGATSDTYDLTGHITCDPRHVICDASESDMSQITSHISREAVLKVLMSFKGGYAQKAPAYSAKKVHGQKLYEMARRGEDVEHLRPIKNVDISEIELIDYNWPDVTFHVTCSSGTYIRSLAHDLGEKLGCGAYLTALRRTKIGEYKIEDAKKLKDF
ncbi:MAG: tRNA pseudouridine(55) synthase TruB [Patescibacteria group bacterium]